MHSESTIDLSLPDETFEVFPNFAGHNITIDVKDDKILEGIETFCAKLSVPGHPGLVEFRNSPISIVIIDNDCELIL